MAVRQERNNYRETFQRFESEIARNGQSWLRPVRREAIERFFELGFPTTRDESWKFTNVDPIAKSSFRLTEGSCAEVTLQELRQFMFPGLTCSQLVFLNGRFSCELSSLRPMPTGVRVCSLKEALTAHRAPLEKHLARYADYRRDAFSALNTAFMDDGAFVSIPDGVVLDEPIHILYVATDTAEPIMTHPRNLIVAGEDSQAIVAEHYVSLTGDVYFSNAVTEVVAGKNSVLSHYLIEEESKRAFILSTLRVQQHRNSSVTSHSALLGGALVRNNVHPVMVGEGCNCLINGLFMPTDRQHMDNFMYVEHASPHCDSRQFYHGILDRQSRGVFSGRIIVHKDAQKTDAKQTNRNLLLSEEAQIDSKPQLEIYADDVKCTHGATIGQINKEAIFYLRSRGISEASARALLLLGFAGESLEQMKVGPIRKYLEKLVMDWIPQGNLLEQSQ